MMIAPMPSPIGHALAGVAIAIAGDRRAAGFGFWRFLARPLTLWSVAIASLPDADLLIPGFHRRATHSIGATILVTIVAAVVTAWVTRSRQSAVASRQSAVGSRQSRVTSHRLVASHQSIVSGPSAILAAVLVCAAAHASHVVMDWLGADWFAPPGIQALWPFSSDWYISGWDLFARVERRDPFSPRTMISNLWAVAREIALVAPIVVAAWWVRKASVSATTDANEAAGIK
jgi:inner membrane protein